MTACLFLRDVVSVIRTTHLNNLRVNHFKNPMILDMWTVLFCRYAT